MDQRRRPRQAGINARAERERKRLEARPDRLAMWALVLAVVVMITAAATARGSGGMQPQGSVAAGCPEVQLGERNLQRGDCGTDVKTLNWILRAERTARGAPLGKTFRRRTERAVRSVQRARGLRRSGVVDRRTRRALVRSMRRGVATFYGPGFYGSRTACGKTLRRRTIGVAHRSLPCGTRVTFKHRGRFLTTKVIDRGPYVRGVRWDLTGAAAKRLGFAGSGTVRAAVAR